MKGVVLFAFLSVFAIKGYSQGSSTYGIFGGAGLATSNNYDYGLSYGFSYVKGVQNHMGLGITIFSQGYSLYYDNEANSAKHGLGTEGFTLRHVSNYIFVAPKVTRDLGSKGYLKFYVNAGVGFLMSGYDSVRKWKLANDPTYANHFDSTIDASDNVNKMVLRVGLGFTQHLHLSNGWWFTVSEDLGFLPGSLTKTGDANNNNPSRTPYSPPKINPGYISLHIGISRHKAAR
ncbi:MAG: hypothetical protein V4649_00610 [Bacteroidota bacterium]